MKITMKMTQSQAIKRANKEIFITIEVDSIREQLLFKHFKPREIVFLLIVFSFADTNYQSFPSLKYIARLMGVSVKTAQGTLRSLRKKEYQGEKVLMISKSKTKDQKYSNNLYKLSKKTGINIFRSREEIVASKKGVGLNLPIKNTQNTKNTQLVKEEPRDFSFNEGRNVGKSQPIPIKELISSKQADLGRKRKIEDVVNLLSKTGSKQSEESALRIVKSHISKLGGSNWEQLFELYKSRGINFYNQVTYKVIQENMSFDEAIKMLSPKE